VYFALKNLAGVIKMEMLEGFGSHLEKSGIQECGQKQRPGCFVFA
jgi:hypothetical protein